MGQFADHRKDATGELSRSHEAPSTSHAILLLKTLRPIAVDNDHRNFGLCAAALESPA
jgi:hypothetical protein